MLNFHVRCTGYRLVYRKAETFSKVLPFNRDFQLRFCHLTCLVFDMWRDLLFFLNSFFNFHVYLHLIFHPIQR
jgi:hypothetical protein